jgi:hypothetical protein
MNKTISYKGKVLKTIHWKEMSTELFEKLKNDYYKKPSFKSVKSELYNAINGGIILKNINEFYFKDLMSKTTLHHSKWSIEDVFNYKPLLEHFYAKTFSNLDVYPPSEKLLKNIETAFRLGGKGTASKPSNFKIDNVRYILKKYNINDNYYDMSCGWGIRMLGSVSTGINYYGTDPNYELTEMLQSLASEIAEIDLFAPSVEIRTQGSETYIPEWENKMGVAFTSPPYFTLEDYAIGDGQSIAKYFDYIDWLNMFYKKTFENVYKYLIPNGHMLINIKNFDKYDLEEQTIKLAKLVGFEYVGTETCNNISRINENGELNDNDESIFVFKKI